MKTATELLREYVDATAKAMEKYEAIHKNTAAARKVCADTRDACADTPIRPLRQEIRDQ